MKQEGGGMREEGGERREEEGGWREEAGGRRIYKLIFSNVIFLFQLNKVEVVKEIMNSKSDSPVEKPVTKMLDTFLSKKEVNMAMDFKKLFKIPDRRFNILRIKNLIQQKDYDKLETFLNEVNRKTPALPWEFVAEMLFEVGNPELAEKYLGKVNDIEEQVRNKFLL